MNDKHDNPLRLEPPVRRSDPALGERLALLARASTPTPVRRRAWRAPLAGLAIVVGTGGLAYGTQAVVRHHAPAVIVPGVDLTPTPSASAADDEGVVTSSAPAEPGRSALPSPVASPGQEHPGAGTRGAAPGQTQDGTPGNSDHQGNPGQGGTRGGGQGKGGKHADRGHHSTSGTPGSQSSAAPGKGRHVKGTKPTTAASPAHPTAHPHQGAG